MLRATRFGIQFWIAITPCPEARTRSLTDTRRGVGVRRFGACIATYGSMHISLCMLIPLASTRSRTIIVPVHYASRAPACGQRHGGKCVLGGAGPRAVDILKLQKKMEIGTIPRRDRTRTFPTICTIFHVSFQDPSMSCMLCCIYMRMYMYAAKTEWGTKVAAAAGTIK